MAIKCETKQAQHDTVGMLALLKKQRARMAQRVIRMRSDSTLSLRCSTVGRLGPFFYPV